MAEPRVVVPVVAGSNPVTLPTRFFEFFPNTKMRRDTERVPFSRFPDSFTSAGVVYPLKIWNGWRLLSAARVANQSLPRFFPKSFAMKKTNLSQVMLFNLNSLSGLETRVSVGFYHE